MDAIGPFSFLRLSGMPERMQGVWGRSVRAGVDGVSLKYMGIGAEPFSLQSFDFALNFEAAKGLYRDYQFSTLMQPLAILYGGVLEPFQLFQVLQVNPLPNGIRAIIRGQKQGDATVYQGVCACNWLLQPIDTTVQVP